VDAPKVELIAEDFRGASWSLKFPNNTEAVIIYTNKGVYRGGHSHNRPETSIVLTGRMKYWKTYQSGREEVFEHGPGETLFNAPGDIHLAYAVESGWLLDWKIGTKIGEAVTTNYQPYRAKVDAQMKEHLSSGR
jgi:hypothetical protein